MQESHCVVCILEKVDRRAINFEDHFRQDLQSSTIESRHLVACKHVFQNDRDHLLVQMAFDNSFKEQCS